MLIGYARDSPHEHTLYLQKAALEKAGCDKIFTDTTSDTKAQRKGLEKALSQLRRGDIFVVWRLDRLGTSVKELVSTMMSFAEQGIGFQSLTEQIDTRASGGRAGIPDLCCITNRVERKDQNRTKDSKNQREKRRQT